MYVYTCMYTTCTHVHVQTQKNPNSNQSLSNVAGQTHCQERLKTDCGAVTTSHFWFIIKAKISQINLSGLKL